MLSELTEWAFDYSYEFIEVDDTVAVGVERFEKTIYILGVNLETKIIYSFCEFVLVKSSGTVVVHNLEAACKTN